jgi:hypothetical protein
MELLIIIGCYNKYTKRFWNCHAACIEWKSHSAGAQLLGVNTHLAVKASRLIPHGVRYV